MFDDLVVGIESKKTSEVDTLPSNEENKENADIDLTESSSVDSENIADDITQSDEENEEEDIEEHPYSVEPENDLIFSQDDLDDAVQKAKNEGYTQGMIAAESSQVVQQNAILETIKGQLEQLVETSEKQLEDCELSDLRFLIAALRKVLPSLAKNVAADEIKKFLTDNFAQLSKQKSLAFFLAPESVKIAAPLIEKAAAQNDFEGKISIHKDESLGISDCRIEWQEGHVERNLNKLLDKIDELLDNN